MGRPAASVALYIPSSSMWLNDSASDTAFVATEQMLSERQIDFDIINIDALATDLKAGPGYLESMSGNQLPHRHHPLGRDPEPRPNLTA